MFKIKTIIINKFRDQTALAGETFADFWFFDPAISGSYLAKSVCDFKPRDWISWVIGDFLILEFSSVYNLFDNLRSCFIGLGSPHLVGVNFTFMDRLQPPFECCVSFISPFVSLSSIRESFKINNGDFCVKLIRATICSSLDSHWFEESNTVGCSSSGSRI